LEFAISLESTDINKSNEMLYCSLCLYDLDENRKISEDFNFEMMNDGEKKENISCVFSVEMAKPSIYLIMSVQVEFCGPHSAAISPYLAEATNPTIIKQESSKFKQRIFWGSYQVFDSISAKVKQQTIQLDSMYQIPQDKKFDYLDFLAKKKGKAGWQDLDNKLKYGVEGSFQFKMELFRPEKHESLPLITLFSSTMNPNVSLQNSLYLYPQSFSSNISSKTPTIGFEVAFVESFDQDEIKPYFVSSMTHATKNPTFFEEIKFNMPIILETTSTIVFTFYHISDDGKKNLVGYSLLPLYLDEKILVDSPSSNLVVYKSLKGASEKKKSDATKSTFTLQYKVLTSIYISNSSLKTYFGLVQAMERAEKKSKSMDIIIVELTKSLEEIQKIDANSIFNHFPQMLNSLFDIIGNATKYVDKNLSTNLTFSALKTIIAIIKKIGQTEGGKRSFSLSSFVKFQYREVSFEKPIHLILLPLLLNFLDETPDPKSQVEHLDLWKYNWFFFEIILKSIAINLNKTNPTSEFSDNQGWTNQFPKHTNFCDDLKSFVTEFCIQMFQNYKKDPEVCKSANRHLALFIRDLIPILHKSQIYEVVRFNFIHFIDYNVSFH
jgi:hypothetical protein